MAKRRSVRQRAQTHKLAMRERRATCQHESKSDRIGLWDPVHDVDKSLGSGKPCPDTSGQKLPNAWRLATPPGSLSIPYRGVELSDPLMSVCTRTSVPPSELKDGAGQTNLTDSKLVCSPNQREPLSPYNAVSYKCKTKVVKNITNEYERNEISETYAGNKTADTHPNKVTIVQVNEDNFHVNTNDPDVIFIQQREQQKYKFTPLTTASRDMIIKHLGANISLNAIEDISEKELLGSPLKSHDITADGNCFFRALSYSITGTEHNYRLLRSKIVFHMLDNEDLFACHLRSGYGTISNYVTKKAMYHNGVWATEVEILAAADFLNTDLFIFEQSSSTWLKFSARQVRGCVDVSKGNIYLMHTYQAHYDVVLDVETEEQCVETFAGNKQRQYRRVTSQDLTNSSEGFREETVEFNIPPAIQGHFNQSDARFLDNAGKQCVMNSLSALIYSQQKQTVCWTSFDVDKILTEGNNMYAFVQRNEAIDHDFLGISDIPRSMEYDGFLYDFIFQESLMGTLAGQPLVEFNFFTLLEALKISLLQDNSDAAFVTFKNSTFAIIKQNELFCVFDSHARSQNGSVCPTGTSVVLHYGCIEDVFQHILRLAESMTYIDTDTFEVTAVKISRAIHPTTDDTVQLRDQTPDSKLPAYSKNINILLEQYLYDQNKKQVTKETTDRNVNSTGCTRKEYMRVYMRKRREILDHRQRDQVADSLRKKTARLNEVYLEQENKSKMVRRRKQVEKHRSIDLKSKRKSRTDPSFLEAERKAKADFRIRAPEKYKKIDLTSKQKSRTDPSFLEAERKSKIDSRKRAPEKYKKIDLTSKQKSRTDPSFLEAERKSKIDLRKRAPEKYKKIDLCSKRKARADSKFLEIESTSKRTARQKQPAKYKQIDKTSKCKAREDTSFLEQENIFKKIARLDPLFLRKEAEQDRTRKRRLRRTELFLEDERLKQSVRRNKKNTEHKSKDRKRKASNRRDNLRYQAEIGQQKLRRFGRNLQECIRKFHKKVERGPEYICTACQQTWFRESVVDSSNHIFSNLQYVYTGYKSVAGKEWICHTCLNTLKKGKIPKLSVANGMKWPIKPPELNLHPLEERLVALRIPFMQIRELPRGGQYSIKGNVVNVPIDLQPTVNALPRRMDENFVIPVKLKKRQSHKSHVFSENVRPNKVIESLNWLMNSSDLYKTSGVKVNFEWLTDTINTTEEVVQEFTKSSRPVDKKHINHQENNRLSEDRNDVTLGSDTEDTNQNDETQSNLQRDSFEEITDDDCVQGNSDTLIDEPDLDTNKVLVLAPGENQQPLSLYHDKHAEELSFPAIFCGQKRLEKDERDVPVSYSDIAKWELRSADRRAATCVPNIFFKLHKIQRKQVADKVNLAVRRKKTGGRKFTAKEALDSEAVNKIVSLDEGYYIFRTLRNSPAYLSSRKKDIFAMIRQLGLPTWFMSLSCADTRWAELLKTLAVLSGRPCSDEEIKNLTWNEKTKLVQKDPVTACRYFDHRVQAFMNTVLKSDTSPVGVVTDYFQRVEFQNRGSPHVHMMIWTENAPKYRDASEEKIVQYVEKYVSCSQDVDEEMQEFVKLQTHKHSKTCKKGGRSVCRFGFPLPPLNRTMVLEPLDTEVDDYREKYSELHKRMNEFKDECNMTYECFLTNVAQMTEKDYIKSIRSSLKGPKVFLKRKPSEMRINYYNETVLKAWEANIDLQFVLDPYACAMYIVSYISKSQRGMSTMLEQASKEAAEGNMDLKHQVRHIGNKFLNFVEISAQEATYLVLQMPLTRSSRLVVFINTSPPEQRVFLLKNQDELESLPDNSTDIESDNIMKRYAKRPKQLEKYCLADYVSELEIVNTNKSRSEEIECNEDDNDMVTSDNDSESEFTDDSIVMKLRNGITIKRRRNRKVIRYVRYSKNTNAENFYREKMLLFMPWRSEEKDIKGQHDSYESHFHSIREDILPLVQKYEHFVEELDLARDRAEADMSEEFDNIAPNTEQIEAEDAEEPYNVSAEYAHFFPSTTSVSNVDIGKDIGLTSVSLSTETKAELLPDAEYRKLIRSLNRKQREFFTHVVKCISTRNEPLYAFLSGGAGVGKSVVIRALFQALHRQLSCKEGDDPDSIKVLLTAFTGKAAYNITGSTIASAFHKKMFQKEQHMHSDELNTFRTTYKDLTVIIIDEISMVGNKLFAFINERLQQLTGTKRDFGGISIIAVGDLYQLSPVADSWIFSDLRIGLAKNLWKDHFKVFELTEIMRQKDDLKFAEMLNRLRFNELTPDDRNVIKSHMTSTTCASYPEHALHLFTENKKVDKFNNGLIERLETFKVEVKADTDVIAPSTISTESKINLLREINKKEKHSQTANLPTLLKLAVNMIYDVTVNLDVQDGLTNGSSSIIKHIEFKEISNLRPAIVWVLFDDCKIGEKRRRQYQHLYHDEIDKQWTPIFEVKRTFLYNKKTYERIQFPLVPAAGKTVHKAQGTTVDELVVDLSSSFKAPHIHYVALSRVRTLAKLHITDFNEKALKVDGNVHEEVKRLRMNPIQLCFTPLYNIDNSRLKLMFHNARSLRRHIEDVLKDPNIHSANIIGIAESRLCSTDLNERYELEGFQMHRIDDLSTTNPTRPNHGLVVYLHNDIELNKIITHEYDGIEYVLIDAEHRQVDVQVVFLYKTPKISVKRLRDCLQHIHSFICLDKPLFILGDFNIDIIQEKSTFPQFMEDLFLCKQLISCPTTINNTLIDHIYTNIDAQAGVIPTYWSDHALVYCTSSL